MTRANEGSSALDEAAGHLETAWFLAAETAWTDGDGLMSAWADTSSTIAVALVGLMPYRTDPLVGVEHQECRGALQAAAAALARLRPGVDLAAEDFVWVMDFLDPAVKHVCGLPPATCEA